MSEIDEAESGGSDGESGSRLGDVPWRRVANVAGLVVLVAVVLPFVVYAVPQLVGANHGYVVLSPSMEPAISPGDVIIVDSVDVSKIEEGDIITFGTSGETTTHRVVGVVEQDGTRAFRTKGDANEGPDQALVTPGEVKGKVMSVGGYLFVIPYIGHVIQFASTQAGFFLLFMLPLALLVVSEVWNLVTATRSSAETDGTATGTAEAAAGDTESETAAEAPAGEDDLEAADGGATFSPADLRLGVVVFAAFLVYGAWVAYTTLETWAFVVAGSAGAAFLLLSVLSLLGGGADDAPESPDEGIAFSAAELQVGLAVLAAFLVYSAWVTYTMVEFWSVGVTVGVGAALLLFSVLYYTGGGTDSDGTDPGSEDEGEDETEPPASAAATDIPAVDTPAADDTPPPPGRDPDVELNLLDEVAGRGDAVPAADVPAAEREGGDQRRSDAESAAGAGRAETETGPDEQVTDGGQRRHQDD